jgi:hypothetical protein
VICTEQNRNGVVHTLRIALRARFDFTRGSSYRIFSLHAPGNVLAHSRFAASPLRPPSHSGKGALFFTDTASDSSDRSFLVFFGFSLATFVDAVAEAEARLKARTKANAKKYVRGVDNLTSIRQRLYSQRMEIAVETGTGWVRQSTRGLSSSASFRFRRLSSSLTPPWPAAERT